MTTLDTLDAAVAAVCADPGNAIAYGVALSVLADMPPATLPGVRTWAVQS